MHTITQPLKPFTRADYLDWCKYNNRKPAPGNDYPLDYIQEADYRQEQLINNNNK